MKTNSLSHNTVNNVFANSNLLTLLPKRRDPFQPLKLPEEIES